MISKRIKILCLSIFFTLFALIPMKQVNQADSVFNSREICEMLSIRKYALSFLSPAQGAQQVSQRIKNGMYQGEIENGLPQGYGIYEWDSGEKYSGTWLNGMMHGKGTYTWNNGYIYIGDWVRNKRTGKGTMSSGFGLNLNGTFRDNKFIDGNIFYSDSKGNSLKEEVINGLPKNRITIRTSNGFQCEVPIFNGALTGSQAKINYPNGDKYTGSIKNGLKHGTGIYTWRGGKHYSGNFENDLINGEGKFFYTFKDNGKRLEGTFKNGQPFGNLVYYDSKNERFNTTWSGGKYIGVSK